MAASSTRPFAVQYAGTRAPGCRVDETTRPALVAPMQITSAPSSTPAEEASFTA